MPTAGFEPAISASERSQALALGRSVAGITCQQCSVCPQPKQQKLVTAHEHYIPQNVSNLYEYYILNL